MSTKLTTDEMRYISLGADIRERERRREQVRLARALPEMPWFDVEEEQDDDSGPPVNPSPVASPGNRK